MKKTFILFFALTFVIILSGCCIRHEFHQANCIAPATCITCGEVEGEALGHQWIEASCVDPKICERCNIEQGSALGHRWTGASCLEPKSCSRCGEVEGEALGHQWIEASCVDPKICERCNIEQGSALGHRWTEANCVAPKTCDKCGLTDGQKIKDNTGHKWKDADCLTPKTCIYCEITEGMPLGHDWIHATCIEPQICLNCSETEGEALGHSVINWINDTPSTCIEQGREVGVCITCSETIFQDIPFSDHIPGDWETIQRATVNNEGIRVKNCLNCEIEIETQNFPMIEVNSLNYIDQSFGYHNFSGSIKNNSDFTIDTISLTFVILDSEYNILSCTYPQVPTRVSPGQSITIDALCEVNSSAAYFSVDECSFYSEFGQFMQFYFPESPTPVPLSY